MDANYPESPGSRLAVIISSHGFPRMSLLGCRGCRVVMGLGFRALGFRA